MCITKAWPEGRALATRCSHQAVDSSYSSGIVGCCEIRPMRQRTLDGALPRMLGGARPRCAPINGPLDTPPVGRAMAAVTLYCGVAITCTVRSEHGMSMRGSCLGRWEATNGAFSIHSDCLVNRPFTAQEQEAGQHSRLAFSVCGVLVGCVALRSEEYCLPLKPSI